MAIRFDAMASNQIRDTVNGGFLAAPKGSFARIAKAGDKRFITGFCAPQTAKAAIAPGGPPKGRLGVDNRHLSPVLCQV